eukprot:9328685-Pyramimonas_sp.AAC.1
MGDHSIAASAAAKERLRAAQQPSAARLETQGGGRCIADLTTTGSFGHDLQKAVGTIMAVVLQHTD